MEPSRSCSPAAASPGSGWSTGLAERSPGVVWFDAHGDFNTPESSHRRLLRRHAAGDPHRRRLADDDLHGRETRTGSGVRCRARRRARLRPASSSCASTPPRSTISPPAAIDSDGAVARAVDAMEPPPTGLYLHLDLDVLDSEEARVNIYSVPDGLSAELSSPRRSARCSTPARFEPSRSPPTTRSATPRDGCRRSPWACSRSSPSRAGRAR